MFEDNDYLSENLFDDLIKFVQTYGVYNCCYPYESEYCTGDYTFIYYPFSVCFSIKKKDGSLFSLRPQYYENEYKVFRYYLTKTGMLEKLYPNEYNKRK